MEKNNLVNFKTSDEASQFVANQIISLVRSKPHCVLGLATGSTPIKTYEYLIQDYQLNKTDYSQVKTFNLDEYCGLKPEDKDQSYLAFMRRKLFDQINLKHNNQNFPDPNHPDQYDDLIQKNGGIDLQILGIGSNGHIGFNEPPANFDSKTSIVHLVQSTIKDNSRFFKDINDVPTTAVSMGISSILKAKQIILLAFGEHKKNAIKRLMELTKFDETLPASSLNHHSNVTIVVDDGAYPFN
ncbi:glucosamine-6-phosphate deaminase [[Mycoplasma] testudinis]|uniref:glucosamine-6-phosphate deaminase n=1 Tax=[Mycoplasma] testudinis TaxID=33924 RepID=UPI000561ADC3|nr:glucosamine-6-phosphate deaminase [[Mycoplasma] testudinis]